MNVVRMERYGPERVQSSRRNQHLRRQSRLLAGLLLIIVVSLAILTSFRAVLMLQRCDNFMFGRNAAGIVVVWCRTSLTDMVAPIGVSGSRPFSTLQIWQAAFLAFNATCRTAPGLFILWTLHRVFRDLSSPNVFSPRLTRRIRAIAWSLFVYAAVPFSMRVGCYLVHLASYAMYLETREVDALLLGLVLLPIAHVMSFGNDIERECESFV